MHDYELETMIVGEFRYRRCERNMNGAATGEQYWQIEEVPRKDGEPQVIRWAGKYGYQQWRNNYAPRRYPEFIEQITWPDLPTAQLAAVAAMGINDDTGMRGYMDNVRYAAKILDLPEIR